MMSTPISVFKVGPGLKLSKPQPIASSSSTQNAHGEGSSEKKLPGRNDYHSRIQALVYHPPQSKFPIRMCSVYQCGVILTRQKDGDGPLCQRHRVEMASKVNPYPDFQPSQQQRQHLIPQTASTSHKSLRRINPYPEVRGSRHGKERERNAGAGRSVSMSTSVSSYVPLGKVQQQADKNGQPRHQLHTLTGLQRSLLAQSDGASFSPLHPPIPSLPALPRPHPTPILPDDGITERMTPQSIETALANRRTAQAAAQQSMRGLTVTVPPFRRNLDSKQRTSSNPPITPKERKAVLMPQYLHDSPVVSTGNPYPFAGDVTSRTIYTPFKRAPVGGIPQASSPSSDASTTPSLLTSQPLKIVVPGGAARGVVSTPAPIPDSSQVGNENGDPSPQTQRRASSLPPPACSSSDGAPAHNTLLGKRKRSRGGSISEEGLKIRPPLRALSEPLISPPVVGDLQVSGWQENMNVDVKEPKEPATQLGMDLVAAVGSAIHDALSDIDLRGLELVYPPEEGTLEFPQPQTSKPYPIIHGLEPATPAPHLVTKNTLIPTIHIPRLPNQFTAIPRSSQSFVPPTSSNFQSKRTHLQVQPLLSTPPSMSSPHPHANLIPTLRRCSTPECNGIIESESTSSRCSKCIMSRWKSRKPAPLPSTTTSFTNVEDLSPALPRLPSLLKRSEKAKGPRKSVTWADGWKSDQDDIGDEERLAIEEDLMREVSGCDSDLTDLSSEQSEEDESESSSDGSDVSLIAPIPTGLKIRIPARPRILPSHADTPIVVETAPATIETTANSDNHPVLPPRSPVAVKLEASVSVIDVSTDSPASSISLPSPSPSLPTSTTEPSVNSIPSIAPRQPDQSDSSAVSTGSHMNTSSDSSSEPEHKPTPLPRIKISLSQLSKLRASYVVSSLSSPSSSPSSTSSSSSTPPSTRPPSPVALSPPPAEPVLVYEPNPSGRKCAIQKCHKALPVGYTWKCCPSCRAHHREDQRERLGCSEHYVRNESDPIKSNGVPSPSPRTSKSPTPSESRKESRSRSRSLGVSEPTPVSVFEPTTLRNYTVRGPDSRIIDMHNLLVSGARLCTIRSCKHILPGPDDYKWKMCHPCRERTTRTRKIRQMKAASRGGLDPSTIDDDVGSLPPLLPDLDLISKGRCPNLDCGVRLKKVREGDADGFVECNQCRWRKMSPDERKANPIELHELILVAPSKSQTNDDEAEGARSSRPQKSASNPYPPSRPLDKTRPATPYPEYLSLSRLLTRFHELFAHFLQAQSYYLSMNRTQGDLFQGRRIAKFSFDGEYSVVAPDFNVLRREKEVAAIVNNVRQEVERLARLKFNPSTRATLVTYGGIVTRYACQSQVPISVPVSTSQPNTYLKSMRGELEVVVLPVDSHSFIPGQRTVVRFRLVG